MALVTVDLLLDLLKSIGFVPLPGLAVPEYINAEVIQEVTDDGVDTFAVQRPQSLFDAARIVLQSDTTMLARLVTIFYIVF